MDGLSESGIRRLVLGALVVSFVLLAVPVSQSKTDRDPVHDEFTDFLRYRYCSRLVLQHPIEALENPLEILAARDPHPDRLLRERHDGYLWEQHPCHPGGVVHVLVHAPFQLLTERVGLSSIMATKIYILLMLAVSHFLLWSMFGSGYWWAALFLYPWLIRSSLSLVETPLTFLFAYLSARSWARGALLAAIAWFALALSGYVRWIVWLPPLALLVAMSWTAFREDVRRALRSRGGRVVIVIAAALIAQALAATAVLIGHFPSTLDKSVTHRPLVIVSCTVALLLWGTYRLINKQSDLALFVLCSIAFLLVYRELTLFWYLAPLLAAFPWARTRTERVLWAGTSLFLAELAIGPSAHRSLLDFRDVASWAIKSWILL